MYGIGVLSGRLATLSHGCTGGRVDWWCCGQNRFFDGLTGVRLREAWCRVPVVPARRTPTHGDPLPLHPLSFTSICWLEGDREGAGSECVVVQGVIGAISLFWRLGLVANGEGPILHALPPHHPSMPLAHEHSDRLT